MGASPALQPDLLGTMYILQLGHTTGGVQYNHLTTMFTAQNKEVTLPTCYAFQTDLF